jgi:TatD DNase family protein
MTADSPPFTLVDSHCHLDFDAFEADRDETVARARAAGIGTMVTICTRVSRFDQIRAIAERYDDVYCSAGVHPHQTEEEGAPNPARLIELSRHPKVVGIGECGLDYYYDKSPRDAQRRSLINHVAAARETGLPLIVHARDADRDMIDLLRAENAQGAFPGVMHCFSSGRKLAETALELGLYLSISGIVTFKNADDLRAIVRDTPLDRLLVETDSPYLAPAPNRGKRNEPAFVVHTAEAVARLKGISTEALAATTTANFFHLFSKARPPRRS